MIQTDKRLRLCGALILCNLIFIWGNSLMPGEISGAISDWVKGILEGLLRSAQEDDREGFLIRKLAHFTEFACLGGLLMWYFGMRRKPMTWAFCLGAAVACIDETIQFFVPDRGPGILDVGIDWGGVAAGMILVSFGHTYFQRKKRSMEDKI